MTVWPSLPLEAWRDTCATLHLWMQIVGKIRLAQSPWVNHSWHVTLYVTPRGLTTSPIAYGSRTFQIDFDFVDHASRGGMQRRRPSVLAPRASAGVGLLPPPHGRDGPPRAAGQDRQATQRGGRSHPLRPGRRAPGLRSRVRPPVLAGARPGRSRVQGVPRPLHREVQSGAPLLGRPGPGGHALLRPHRARASGGHSQPAGPGDERSVLARGQQLRLLAGRRFGALRRLLLVRLSGAPGFLVSPRPAPEAFYSSELREFLLPYEIVRGSETPDEVLLDFLQTTYEAAATLGHWDRDSLERR